MTRTMPQSSPFNTLDTLATFHQVKESHHDFVNLLTHQMATILYPLIDLTNQQSDVINRQMNRTTATLDVNDNPDNQNVHNERRYLHHHHHLNMSIKNALICNMVITHGW